MKSVCLILALLVLCSIQVCSSKKKETTPKIVIPDYMTILGITEETVWNKKKFLTFHDIRYAHPLSDETRFSSPTPHIPTEDEVYDGTLKTVDCPSLKTLELHDLNDAPITEDCLYLTVSTKNKTGNSTVMVHLGGYDIIKEENTNDFSDPGFLLEEDVVLVSVQYRVGVFGFLSSMTDEIPGNVGVLDVIEALRWVKKYISYFGGNPNNVTIFGQYHSAAIIHILTMTPLLEKEPLFHKVIYQSGSALLPGVINKEPLEMVKHIAKILKIESESISEISNDIKMADPVEILRAYKDYVNNFDKEDLSVPLIVVGDPNGVLPEDPKVLLKKRKYRVYPTMGGVVEQPSTCALDFLGNLGKNPVKKSSDTDSSEESEEKEFMAKKGKKKNSTLEEDIAEGANIFRDVLILEVPANGEQAEYINELFPKKIFTANFIKSLAPTVIDMHSIPVKHATLNALKHNTAKGGKSYLYAFNYNPDESRLQCQDNVFVVQLTDDDIFLFPQSNDNLKNLSKKETRLARMMVELWTSFAATGKPEAHSLYDWPQMKLGLNGPYFIIDSIHKVGFDYTEEYFSGLRAQRNNIEVLQI